MGEVTRTLYDTDEDAFYDNKKRNNPLSTRDASQHIKKGFEKNFNNGNLSDFFGQPN